MEKLDLSYMGPMFKQIRLAKKVTQDELAERVGITSRFLQPIEGNERGVSLDTFIQLIRALGISADTVVYPEKETDDGETEQLIRCIRLLNSRDRKVLLASARQMLVNE